MQRCWNQHHGELQAVASGAGTRCTRCWNQRSPVLEPAISAAATGLSCAGTSTTATWNRQRRRRVCSGSEGVCWNQLVYVLQGRCLAGGSYIQR